ncbi:MAG: hypothetical protein FJ280_27760, partial [Planctomycetes bacterium]|nr:hypothetical protein [Planctomycetota bacterium]
MERPRPGGHEGRTVTATYFVESTIPIPPADKCEIDLSGVGVKDLGPLQGAIKTYAVVDPVAKGLFEWIVRQGDSPTRAGPVSDTLFCGEPIQFYAQWRPDQNVSAIHFEIPGPSGAVLVDLPLTAGTNRAQVQQVVSGLTPGEVFPLYVHVTMQPAPAGQPLHVKLRGGQFRAEDRRIVLKELTLGDGTPADSAGYVWEPLDIPLQAQFRGYKADNPAHNAAIEQFKKSCVVTATSRAGAARNITETIEWTSVTPPEGAARTCRLAGRVRYMPETFGRTAIEVTAQAPMVRGMTESAAQRAYVHVLAKGPRLALTVSRLKPGGEERLFDSRYWVRGQSSPAPLVTRLSTRLRVDLQSLDPLAVDSSQSWTTTVRLLRRATTEADWVTAFSEAGELTWNQPLTREVQIALDGQYALEVVGQDRQSHRPTVYVLTPVLASIQPHEVKPGLAPPAWLTTRVRQWPFEYLVTLYQDTVDLSQPQALAFQFQLPGQSESWLDGATAVVGPQTAQTRQLAVRGPRLLPILGGLHDGVARFQVSAQGLEILRWECPNIRVVPPVLEGLSLSRDSAGALQAATGGVVALDGSADLWVRPAFRPAPELEGQWVASETAVYLWRLTQDNPAEGPPDVRVLERLQEREKSEGSGPRVRVFATENPAGSEAVEVLSRRTPRGFWGWPKRALREKYALVASVIYRPWGASEASGSADVLPAVAEWSDVQAIHLDAPWVVPMCWWPILAVALMAVVAMVLRVLVPSPSRLALDMRLEDNVAVVEPVRLDNPVLVDLRETSLAEELVLYTRYLCGRWHTAGRKLARQAGRPPESTLGTVLGGLLRELFGYVPSFIRFLKLDTDASDDGGPPEGILADFINLFHYIDVGEVVRDNARFPEFHPHLDWMRGFREDATFADYGCQGIPRLGRLVFFELRETIIHEAVATRFSSLRTSTQQIVEEQPDQFVLAADGAPAVHIASSVCGGT